MAGKKKNTPQKNNPPGQKPGNNPGNKALLTPEEWLAQKCLDPLNVMDLLKIGRTTLNNWCKKELLVVSKVENRLYFDVDDVAEMLDKGKRRGKG